MQAMVRGWHGVGRLCNTILLINCYCSGWNYTRLSDVHLQRLNSNGDILNAAALITSTGCVHPAMRSICPEPPTFEQPLGYRLGFRAVMFQGMKSGDEMVMSVKLLGCIQRADCFVVRAILMREHAFLYNLNVIFFQGL